jgi:hypothetical protein
MTSKFWHQVHRQEALKRGATDAQADSYARRQAGMRDDRRQGPGWNDDMRDAIDAPPCNRTREVEQLDIKAVASMLAGKALQGALASNYRGDIGTALTKLFNAHQREFSPCERKQVRQIVEEATVIVERAMSGAREEMSREQADSACMNRRF